MFIRQYFRKEKGRRTAYWALVESYRTVTGPRQRIVAWLGKLDEAGRLGVQQAVEGTQKQTDSSSQGSGSVTSETLQPLGRQMRFEFDDDASATEPRWVEINTAGIRIENLRQFGGPWLALHLIRTLQLDSFLERTIPDGRERVGWDISSLILMIARLLEPSSELHTAEQWYPKTALPDLLGVPEECLDDSRLYRTMDVLLLHKEALECHLKNRLGTLFDLKYDLLLYDITSTYFEGEADFPLAKRGDSRDQRSDCKQACIGLVVSRCGHSKKEEAITQKFEKKIEEALTRMKARCEKQHRSAQKVEREIGRLLGQNTRAARLFAVKVTSTDEGAARIEWSKIEIGRASCRERV